MWVCLMGILLTAANARNTHTVVVFIIKNPINPSEMLGVCNQIQICSDASEKNLTSD